MKMFLNFFGNASFILLCFTHSLCPFLFQWPPLVEVAETRQLPPMLVERYNAAAGEGTALCGIFSEVHRAWATVDNSFFIWRFDKW